MAFLSYEGQAECCLVRAITPVVGRSNIRMTSPTNHGNFAVAGVLPWYFQLRTAPLAAGRLPTDADADHRRQVAVLGDEVRRVLFAGRTPRLASRAARSTSQHTFPSAPRSSFFRS